MYIMLPDLGRISQGNIIVYDHGTGWYIFGSSHLICGKGIWGEQTPGGIEGKFMNLGAQLGLVLV